MLNRRSFLATAGAAAAGLAVGCRSAAATAGQATSAAPVRLDRIGVQLYSVRDQMEKDLTATLERVARIGYKEVEFAGYFGRSPQDVRALLDRLGLTAPSSHIG